MRSFIQRYVSPLSIGRGSLIAQDYSDDQVRREFIAYYIPMLDGSNEHGHIQLQGDDSGFIPRADVIPRIISTIASVSNATEKIMHVYALEDGGQYQTGTLGSTVGMIKWINKYLTELIKLRPSIGTEGVWFLDAGCGNNYPALAASAVAGWNSIGIEVTKARVFIAADASLRLLETKECSNLSAALFQADISRPANWEGIHVVLLWDKVFNVEIVQGAVENLHRSYTGPILVIMSTEKLRERLPIVQDYFHVKEGGKFKLSFKGGKGSYDWLQIFRLIRRNERYTAPTCGPSIVQTTKKMFGCSSAAHSSHSTTKDRFEAAMSLSRKRKATKIYDPSSA